MEWAERHEEGFALAAAACGDRGASQALRGLSADVAEPVAALARRLAASDVNARRQWVRAVLESRGTRAEISAAQHGRPPRALALLAASVDKQLGRKWLAGAALPRPGYVPGPGLLALLQRLAARPLHGEAA